MTTFDIAAYLARLGLDTPPAGAKGLAALQEAQIRRITFENIDALLGHEPSFHAAEVTRKVIARQRGGWCFELNTLLRAALQTLGYRVERRLARVRMGQDSGGARSHMALVCEIDGTRWLADAGFGGPGPLTPLLLDSDAVQVAPNGTYILRTDARTGERVVSLCGEAGPFALYGVDEALVTDPDVVASSYVCATWSGSPFPAHLMVNGHDGDTRIGLFDRSMTLDRNGRRDKADLQGVDDLRAVLCGRLGLGLDEATLDAVWHRIGAAGASGDTPARRQACPGPSRRLP